MTDHAKILTDRRHETFILMACMIDSYAGGRNTDRTRGFREVGTAKRYIGINIFSRLGAWHREGREPTTGVVVNVNGDERRDECVSIGIVGTRTTSFVERVEKKGRERDREAHGSGKTRKVCFRGEEDRLKEGGGRDGRKGSRGGGRAETGNETAVRRAGERERLRETEREAVRENRSACPLCHPPINTLPLLRTEP